MWKVSCRVAGTVTPGVSVTTEDRITDNKTIIVVPAQVGVGAV